MQEISISVIGAAIDACAGTRGSALTPNIIKDYYQLNNNIKFQEIFSYVSEPHNIHELHTYFTKLAKSISLILQNKEFPIIIGGDHSCAIGTWSGISTYLNTQNQTLGLIWCDAHMDAHTPYTTFSGNIHGMPVATLLGYGYKDLINILSKKPKILPKNIVLMGIRSFEPQEKQLLDSLGVKVYYISDIKQYGFLNIFKKAITELSTRVDKIGLSIDLDGFDPIFAPGVGTQVPDGINFDDFLNIFTILNMQKIIAIEITEGNQLLDKDNKTMQCIIKIINLCLTNIKNF